jgi:membrane protein involved in colicin uptake
MSDELNVLQESATQARAKADELKAALTDVSSDEERQAAEEADKAATDSESTLADAKAKADADAAAQAEADAKAKADAEAADQGGDAATPGSDESRTGFVTNARPGDECTCPDGRKGTVHKFDEGLVCIPNHDQGN